MTSNKSAVSLSFSPKRKSKYNARKTIVDGIVFDSAKEAARYSDLSLLEKAKVIKGLKRQVKFPIVINGKKICVWSADFVYTENGQEIREDCKGYRTKIYRLKKRLVEASYGFKIREV
jgi:hypothetical protein